MTSYIIIFLSYFIFQIFILKTFQNFLKEEKHLNKFILIILYITNATINTFLFFQNVAAVSSIYNFVFFFVLTKLAFRISIKQTIFYSVVVWTFAIILDILIMNIMMFFPKVIFESAMAKMISTIFLITCLLIISKTEKLNRYIKSIYEKFNKTDFSKLILFLAVASCIVLDVVCLYNIEIQNFGILIFIMVFSLVIILIVFLSKQYAIYILKTSNEFLLKNGKESVKVINNYRILKHNITNQLLGIKTVANKRTKELIDELIQSYDENFYSTAHLLDIPSGINGLVFEKINSLKNQDVNIEIDNKITGELLKKIGAKDYNQLCEAIGVSLDNAIEAVVSSTDKILYLKFYEDEKDYIIKIINSFNGTLDIESLGTIDYSSKGASHGIGIFSLLQKKNIKIKYEIKNNLFKTIIRMEKSENNY